MIRTETRALALALILVPGTSPALAGPNAGGVLLLHANPAAEISAIDYCGISELSSCENAITRVDGSESQVVWVLASFPPESQPQLKGVTFGIRYDPSAVVIADWRGCAEVELEEGFWPSSGSGVALAWRRAVEQRLVDVYWFEAYAYEGAVGRLELIPHPTHGGNFADEAVPVVLDGIDAYGSLGFGLPGFAPCARSIQGGCCLNDEVFVLGRTDCEAMGGEFFPHYIDGDGSPCVLPTHEGSWGEIKWTFADR